jgi:hypothetical protein
MWESWLRGYAVTRSSIRWKCALVEMAARRLTRRTGLFERLEYQFTVHRWPVIVKRNDVFGDA